MKNMLATSDEIVSFLSVFRSCLWFVYFSNNKLHLKITRKLNKISNTVQNLNIYLGNTVVFYDKGMY